MAAAAMLPVLVVGLVLHVHLAERLGGDIQRNNLLLTISSITTSCWMCFGSTLAKTD